MVEKCRVIKEQKIAIAELEKALDRETEDIGNSLTVLDTKEKILAETKDKLETALNDVQAKSDEVLRLTSLLDENEMYRRAEQLSQQSQELAQQLNDLTSEKSVLTNQLNESNRELEHTQKQLEETSSQRDHLQEEKGSLESRLSKADGEVQKLQAQIDEVLQQSQMSNDEKNAEIKGLKSEISEIQAKLDSTVQDRDHLSSNLDEMRFSMNDKTEALEEMKAEFCKAKNIKLKPSKFFISNCIEFGGCRISAERLKDKGFIFIKPKENRIRAFSELKRPTTKREAQVWSGMVSSLAAWAPATSVACPLLRKATARASKLQWTDALEREYQDVRRLIKNNLKLSPYDPSQFLNLCIDGSAIHGVGYILFQWTDERNPSKEAIIVSALRQQ